MFNQEEFRAVAAVIIWFYDQLGLLVYLKYILILGIGFKMYRQITSGRD